MFQLPLNTELYKSRTRNRDSNYYISFQKLPNKLPCLISTHQKGKWFLKRSQASIFTKLRPITKALSFPSINGDNVLHRCAVPRFHFCFMVIFWTLTFLWHSLSKLIKTLHSSVCKCGDKSGCIFRRRRWSTAEQPVDTRVSWICVTVLVNAT